MNMCCEVGRLRKKVCFVKVSAFARRDWKLREASVRILILRARIRTGRLPNTKHESRLQLLKWHMTPLGFSNPVVVHKTGTAHSVNTCRQVMCCLSFPGHCEHTWPNPHRWSSLVATDRQNSDRHWSEMVAIGVSLLQARCPLKTADWLNSGNDCFYYHHELCGGCA